MNPVASIFPIAVAASLAGCATTQPVVEHATIKGIRNLPVISAIQGPRSASPISSVLIRTIDGRSAGNVWVNEADNAMVQSGTHELGLVCRGELEGQIPFEYAATLRLDAAAGATYQLVGRLDGESCVVSATPQKP